MTQLPMPAEAAEADDEIDIEGDDDIPLLHHEARLCLSPEYSIQASHTEHLQ